MVDGHARGLRVSRDLYFQHSHRHSPHGTDPTPTEDWHKIGDIGEHAFVNSWTGKFWFRLVQGKPGTLTSSLETLVNINGGADGTQITQLPMTHVAWLDGGNASDFGQDNTGAPVPYYIDGTDGKVYQGPEP